MLATRKDLKERIEALEARSGELEDELTVATEEAKSKAEELEASNTARDEAIADLNDQAESLTDAESKVAKLEADNEALQAKLDDDTERVTKAAVKEIAKVGHDAIEDTKEDPIAALTPDAVREKFAAMPAGEARTKFYQENRDVLAK